MGSEHDRQQIEAVIDGLVEAWTAGNADSFASYFSEDADFTVWFGLHMEGREQIAFGHRMIFDTFYANTTWALEVEKVRFLHDDTAIVHAAGAVVPKGEPLPEEPDAVPLLVFSNIGGNWKIVALQNTPFAIEQFRNNRDINEMKSWASESKKD